MFGGLARNNSMFKTTPSNNQPTAQRSRHLSETNMKNVQPEKLTQPSQSPHLTANEITVKNSTSSKSGAMLSLPPNINSPLTTFL